MKHLLSNSWNYSFNFFNWIGVILYGVLINGPMLGSRSIMNFISLSEVNPGDSFGKTFGYLYITMISTRFI